MATGRGLVLAMLAVALPTADASAQPRRPPEAPSGKGDTCVSAYEQAQQNQRKGRLLQARADLLLCQRVCPTALAGDCDRWLVDVNTTIPTVKLAAKDARGQSLSSVTVDVDGASLVQQLDGSPVEVDPGQHTFVFERTAPPGRVEARVVVKPREQGQPIVVTFEDAVVPGALERGPPTLAWVLGGVAIAGLGVGAVLGLKGQLDKAELKADDGCAPSCPREDVDAIATQWTVAAVAAAAGGAAGAAALLVWLSDEPPSGAAAGRNAGPRLGIGARPRTGGAIGVMTGRF